MVIFLTPKLYNSEPEEYIETLDYTEYMMEEPLSSGERDRENASSLSPRERGRVRENDKVRENAEESPTLEHLRQEIKPLPDLRLPKRSSTKHRPKGLKKPHKDMIEMKELRIEDIEWE